MILKEAIQDTLEDVALEHAETIPERMRARLLAKTAAGAKGKYERTASNVLNALGELLVPGYGGGNRRYMKKQIGNLDDEMAKVTQELANLTNKSGKGRYKQLKKQMDQLMKQHNLRRGFTVKDRAKVEAKMRLVMRELKNLNSGTDPARAAELTKQLTALAAQQKDLSKGIRRSATRSAVKTTAGGLVGGSLVANAALDKDQAEQLAAKKAQLAENKAKEQEIIEGGAKGNTAGAGGAAGKAKGDGEGEDINPYLYGAGGGFFGGAAARAAWNKATGKRPGRGVMGTGLAGMVLVPAAIATYKQFNKANA